MISIDGLLSHLPWGGYEVSDGVADCLSYDVIGTFWYEGLMSHLPSHNSKANLQIRCCWYTCVWGRGKGEGGRECVRVCVFVWEVCVCSM